MEVETTLSLIYFQSAVEYRVGNLVEAKKSLTDLPPRNEEEVDAVTLHNQVWST